MLVNRYITVIVIYMGCHMFMSFFVVLSLCLLCSQVVEAARVREIWTLAWDPYLQQAQIAYFLLEIDRDALVYQTLQISKTNTTVSDVFIPSGLSGVFTAVLRACDSNNACSANSNRVVFDRASPEAPVWLKYNK